MDIDVVRRASIFLAENRQKYQMLADDIRNACEAAAKGKVGVIRRIYGRDEKQEGTRLKDISLKAPAKVAKKWLEEFNGTGPFSQVHDIAGLTVVVYYPDQIDGVLTAINAALASARLEAGTRHEKKDDGYFATHVVYTSNNVRHVDLKCELQIKTMLHEAWSSKTHDLTYKPRVRNDERLSRMMNAIANSIQAIEIQSETVRQLIHDRWNADARWREALQGYSFKSLPTWAKMETYGSEAKAIRDLIESHEEHLRQASIDDSVYQDIAVRVIRLCGQDIREGYMLHAYLGVVSGHEAEREAAIESAQQWLAVADDALSAGKAQSYEVWSIPLVLQACGDLSAAIWAGRKLYKSTALGERERQIVAFNLANHLVEDSYFTFPGPRTALPEKLRDARDRTMAEVQSLLTIAQPLRAKEKESFLDLDGMIAVVFSGDSKEVYSGIENITAGNTNVPDGLQLASAAYYNLHIRMAWRRLLELETSPQEVK